MVEKAVGNSPSKRVCSSTNESTNLAPVLCVEARQDLQCSPIQPSLPCSVGLTPRKVCFALPPLIKQRQWTIVVLALPFGQTIVQKKDLLTDNLSSHQGDFDMWSAIKWVIPHVNSMVVYFWAPWIWSVLIYGTSLWMQPYKDCELFCNSKPQTAI